MKKISLNNVVLINREIRNLRLKEKKRYIMFTCMVRDLNFLQKLLIFSMNESTEGAPFIAAKETAVFFFVKTLISKIHEMWEFIDKSKVKIPNKKKKIIEGYEGFSRELKEKYNEIEQLFSDNKIRKIFKFVRNNFGFHYAYDNNVDKMIEDVSKQFSEFEMWLSDDSGNEIFVSSNHVIRKVILEEMKNLGFSGNVQNGFMGELADITLKGARLFREFSVFYIVEAFDVKWEKREKVEIEVPQLSQVTLPLIVAQ